eukprot:1502099-Prymnesium_polylepis.1
MPPGTATHEEIRVVLWGRGASRIKSLMYHTRSLCLPRTDGRLAAEVAFLPSYVRTHETFNMPAGREVTKAGCGTAAPRRCGRCERATLIVHSPHSSSLRCPLCIDLVPLAHTDTYAAARPAARPPSTSTSTVHTVGVYTG